jgi:hypothetical protein
MDWISPHRKAQLDFALIGGEDRVRSTLAKGEMILHAEYGALEEMGAVPGARGKRRDGLAAITNRRLVLVRAPGLLRKDPPPLSVPFESIYNCGTHTNDPRMVVIATYDNHRVSGYYVTFESGSGDHEPTAMVWAEAIRQSAEAAEGPANAPPGLL